MITPIASLRVRGKRRFLGGIRGEQIAELGGGPGSCVLHQQDGQIFFFSLFSLILGFSVTFCLFFNFYKLCPQLL